MSEDLKIGVTVDSGGHVHIFEMNWYENYDSYVGDPLYGEDEYFTSREDAENRVLRDSLMWRMVKSMDIRNTKVSL